HERRPGQAGAAQGRRPGVGQHVDRQGPARRDRGGPPAARRHVRRPGGAGDDPGRLRVAPARPAGGPAAGESGTSAVRMVSPFRPRWSLLMRTTLFLAAALLATAARADDIISGPEKGAKVPALEVFDATGPNQGKTVDYAAERKDRPTVYAFVQADQF